MSQIAIKGADTGTGVFTLESPATNTDRTLTIPDQTGKVMATGGGAVNVSTSAADDSVVVDASGNLGLGVTPSAWGSGSLGSNTRALEIGSPGNVLVGGSAATGVYTNTYATNSGSFYGVNGGALAYQQNLGTIQHRWYTATSGTAGNAISFNQTMTIDSSGRVTMPYQPHVFGSPTNTGGSGAMNSFHTKTSQGGMSVSGTSITVPVTGLYLVTFNTICGSSSGRKNAVIVFSDGTRINTLSEDNGIGFHYRSASIVKKMSANDYLWFDNDDWYDATTTGFVNWRTASVTLIS